MTFIISYIFQTNSSSRKSFLKLLACASFFSLLLLFSNKAFGQVTLIAETSVTTKGQTIDIPIKIVGFSNIFSMQFSMNWDSTVLDFKDIHSFTQALPQFGKDGIGRGLVSSGNLIAIWFDNSLKGISLEDSTTLFVLQFEVIGEEGTNSSIAFSNKPAVIEITDADATILDVTVANGEVLIPAISTATTYLQAENGMRIFQNHPNPFHDYTTIDASFKSSEWALLTITDASGRSVYEEHFLPKSGLNSIILHKDKLPAAGIYNYTMQNGNYQISKQMILLP